MAKTSSSVPSGRTRSIPPPRRDSVVPSFPSRRVESVVADGDVDPAVDPYTDAVGRVVAAPLVDQAGRQARDEDFLAIGGPVAILIVEDAEERRMQDPDFPVLGDQAPRVLHPGEHVDAIGLAVAVVVDAAKHPAAPRPAAERPLLVHGDKHFAAGRHRQGYRIADLRRCCEQRDPEPRRRL